MCKKLIFLLLVLAFGLTVSAQAADIIWVSDNLNSTDTDWIDLLELNGYSVDLSFADQQGKELDAAEIAALNAADLIIVTRNLTAVDYATDGTEVSEWNGIATPLMALSAHPAQAKIWNWFSTSSTKNTNVNMTAEVPSHPVFDGIALDPNNQVSVVTSNCKTVNSTSAGNGSVIGKRFDDDGVWIATWEKGVEFYSGAGQTAGDLRMLFPATKTDGGASNYGKYILTAEGEKMFLNAVAYMLGLFDLDPSQASEPYPKNKAIDVSRTPTLTWTPGDSVQESNGHDVYFGETFDDVNDANSTVNPNVTYQNRDVNDFDPGVLDLGKTYYWRVDEINDANDASPWKGAVWYFTVTESLVVDDMEKDYVVWGATGLHVFDVWVDGSGNCDAIPGNGTGSLVSLEQTISYPDGSENSMKLDYENDGTVTDGCPPNGQVSRLTYSMLKAQIADLPSGIDPNWLTGGAKALALQFYGDVDNDVEPMWVELTDDSGVTARGVTYGSNLAEDINDVLEESWHQWNIDLQDFVDNNSVDLTEVNSIAIIIGDPADDPNGSGTVYFDDIRLYAARCVQNKRDADFAKFDYAPTGPGGDCVIDGEELDVMFGDWLDYDSTVYADDPCDANLVGHWEFEGDFNDSSGSGYDGDPYGGATIVPDATRDSNVLSLDGYDDYVNITGYEGITADRTDPNNPVQPAFSIACWLKTDVIDKKTIVSWGSGDGAPVGGQYLTFCIDGGTLRIEHGGGNLRGDTSVNDGEWHHCALTVVEGGNLRVPNTILYVDGQEDTVFSGSDNIFNLTADVDVSIGVQGWFTGNTFFEGLIDDVRIYDYALSQGEILGVGGLGDLYFELTSVANVYDEELKNSKVVNFLDYAVLAERWLEKDYFPPE